MLSRSTRLAAAAAPLLVPATAQAATPALRLTAHPAALSGSASAAFAWQASAGAAVRCRLDRAAYRPCARRLGFHQLADGSHELDLRASAGRRSASVAYRWRVDTTAPTRPQVALAPASGWSTTSLRLTASAIDRGAGVARYEYELARDPFAMSWGKPHAGRSFSSTTEGFWIVRFRALDGVGNASAWSAPASGGVDRTAPTIDDAALFGWRDAAPSWGDLEATASDDSIFLPSLEWAPSDGAAPTGPWMPGAAYDGATAICLRATDQAGNVATLCGRLRLDVTPPTAASVSGPQGTGCAATLPQTWTASGATDEESGVQDYEWAVRTRADERRPWTSEIYRLGGSLTVETSPTPDSPGGGIGPVEVQAGSIVEVTAWAENRAGDFSAAATTIICGL